MSTDNNTVQIERAAEGAELEVIAGLAGQIWREYYTPIIGSEQVEYMLKKFQSLEAMRRQLQEGFEYYLVRAAGSPAGYFSFQPRAGGVLFLSKIYVSRTRRGSGLGRASLQFIFGRAQELGLDTIELTVNKHNSGSIAAYERWGFVRSGAAVSDIGGGFVMDDWVYKLRLAAPPA